MQTRLVKRLWNGLASLRGYEVNRFINDGGVQLRLPNGETMTMTVEFLKDKSFQVSTRQFQSKHNARQTYDLIDYRWRPDKLDINQQRLF